MFSWKRNCSTAGAGAADVAAAAAAVAAAVPHPRSTDSKLYGEQIYDTNFLFLSNSSSRLLKKLVVLFISLPSRS